MVNKMTVKIKHDIVSSLYDINVLTKLGTVREIMQTKEDLIDLAQQLNNELIPIIGEENLYERD